MKSRAKKTSYSIELVVSDSSGKYIFISINVKINICSSEDRLFDMMYWTRYEIYYLLFQVSTGIQRTLFIYIQ